MFNFSNLLCAFVLIYLAFEGTLASNADNSTDAETQWTSFKSKHGRKYRNGSHVIIIKNSKEELNYCKYLFKTGNKSQTKLAQKIRHGELAQQ